jgi:hypothetical protein
MKGAYLSYENPKKKKKRAVEDPRTDTSRAYGYFDGVATKSSNTCGVGGILFFFLISTKLGLNVIREWDQKLCGGQSGLHLDGHCIIERNKGY